MSNEEIVKQIQQGINPGDNMDQLYQQNFRLIYLIAKRYKRSDHIDDLVQEAYFGLCEAVKRYENTAGVKFMSYAAYWIKQSIHRYLENNGRCIRIPSVMQGYTYKYNRAISAFRMELGRKPTDQELSRYIGIGEKTLEEVKKAVYTDKIQSLDDYLPGSEDITLSDNVSDPLIDIENNVIDRMIEQSKQRELWEIVKGNITPEQNTVINARFRKNMSLESTGQLIGKSRDTVRNLEAQALRKLRLRRITRQIEEKFEVNYTMAYRGGINRFSSTWNSIVEDIAIRNLEVQNEVLKINTQI